MDARNQTGFHDSDQEPHLRPQAWDYLRKQASLGEQTSFVITPSNLDFGSAVSASSTSFASACSASWSLFTSTSRSLISDRFSFAFNSKCSTSIRFDWNGKNQASLTEFTMKQQIQWLILDSFLPQGSSQSPNVFCCLTPVLRRSSNKRPHCSWNHLTGAGCGIRR